MTEAVRKAERDSKGRFLPGNTANPKGNNQFTSIVPLIEALKEAGKKRGEDFWAMVAERVWTNDTVLIAILKKIIPDKFEGEGFNQFQTFFTNIIQKAGMNGFPKREAGETDSVSPEGTEESR